MNNKDIVIVLGVSGMLGHKIFEVLTSNNEYNIYGTVSNNIALELIPTIYTSKIINNINALNISSVEDLIIKLKPKFVINAIGVIKQNNQVKDNYNCIYLNALFPHKLSQICANNNCKLIHISTDCVFDGQKGSDYTEEDEPTCHDVYGMSKYLGEVAYENCLTLRTSIIGHELNSNLSLVDWFLNTNTDTINGYTEAIFSGFTTLELSNIINNIITNYAHLSGLYQISANYIDKYSLLKIINSVYNKNANIIKSDVVKINRSLNSNKLKDILQYKPQDWHTLISNMYNNFTQSNFYLHRSKTF